jgi:hypothetical protein
MLEGEISVGGNPGDVPLIPLEGRFLKPIRPY